MNKNVFRSLRPGDMVEPKNLGGRLTVKEIIDDSFMRDSVGMVWYRGNLKDRSYLKLDTKTETYLDNLIEHSDDPIMELIREYDVNHSVAWPIELQCLFFNNRNMLYDALLYKSYFSEEE